MTGNGSMYWNRKIQIHPLVLRRESLNILRTFRPRSQIWRKFWCKFLTNICVKSDNNPHPMHVSGVSAMENLHVDLWPRWMTIGKILLQIHGTANCKSAAHLRQLSEGQVCSGNSHLILKQHVNIPLHSHTNSVHLKPPIGEFTGLYSFHWTQC